MAVILLGAIASCLEPNPIGPGDGDERGDDEIFADSTGPMGEDAPVDTSSSDTDAGTEESAGETGSAGESGSDAETGGDAEGEASSGGAPPDMANSQTCGNIDGLSMGCQTCLEANCCEDVAACADDLVCACLLTCLLAGSGDEVCSLDCGASPGLPTLAGLLGCAEQACADSC